MALGAYAAEIETIEKSVLEEFLLVGRIPTPEELARTLKRSPTDLKTLLAESPAYTSLAATNSVHVAECCGRAKEHPEFFSSLKACAAYVQSYVDRQEIERAEKELHAIRGGDPDAA